MALPPPFADSCPPFWTGGPDPATYYNFPNRNNHKQMSSSVVNGPNPNTRSQYPVTTGTSVIGIRYKDGIVMAADTMGSYGSLARFPDLQRLFKVNDTTVIGFSGDLSDYQYLRDVVERKQIEEDIHGGGVTMRPQALHCWLTRVMYNRRSKFDPLWNTILVGGIQKDKPFLGCVDMIGTAWKEDIIATGLGANLTIPAIQEGLDKKGGKAENLSLEDAKELIKRAIKVCYLRDCRATPKYHLATINMEGSSVEGPLMIESNWEIAKSIKGYD